MTIRKRIITVLLALALVPLPPFNFTLGGWPFIVSGPFVSSVLEVAFLSSIL